MNVQRRQGSALWHQVELALASEIGTGRRAVGERLPTEPELMARFGVSRATVRQAIASLERRGLVRAEQGRGTFVHRDVLTYPLSRRTRFSANLIAQGFDPGGMVLCQEVIAADAEVAEKLRVGADAAVWHRRGIGTANGMPVEIASVYLPAVRFPDFDRVRARNASYTATFAAYGIADYVRLETTVEARMPTAAEARALRQPESVPVLAVSRVDADLDGRPILFGRTAWSGERVVFEISDRDGAPRAQRVPQCSKSDPR